MTPFYGFSKFPKSSPSVAKSTTCERRTLRCLMSETHRTLIRYSLDKVLAHGISLACFCYTKKENIRRQIKWRVKKDTPRTCPTVMIECRKKEETLRYTNN